MDYINQLYEDLKNDPPDMLIKHPYEIEKGRVFMYSQKELLEKMQALDSMKDEEVFNILTQEYSVIFSEIFESHSDRFNFLLRSPRFINILTQVVSVNTIPYEDVVHLNSFIYNFLMYTDYNEESYYIRKLLFMLGEALNKKYVSRLIGCDLDITYAIFTVVSLNSSFNPQTNIKRMNFTLATMPELLTIQKAIEIYENLFDSVTNLIIGTVFDTGIPDSSDKDWVTPQVSQSDANIAFAVLSILESLSPYELTKVLESISYEFRWRNCDEASCKVYFHKLDPNVYVKTRIIMEQLEEEGYIFP